MEYSSPELIVIGHTQDLVLGAIPGPEDNPGDPDHALVGLVLGLDD
ncbi:MAG TPA: hypothetical protein VI485_14695 [Vicinamibacterales bacterium]|nr:hypothetical protein [Vicinamibacterales bacterium]